jgi:hypothetical protein
MRQTMLGGLLLAVATGLLILLADPLSLDVEHVALLGAGLGAVLGLIGDRPVLERVAGFAVGFVVTWIAYGARAQYLPDSSGGRAVAAFGIVVLFVLAVWLSSNRLQLWTMLIGAVALIGAYEEIYTAAPPKFLDQSPEAATQVLLAVAIGFVCTTLPSPWQDMEPAGGRHRGGETGGRDTEDKTEDVTLDSMLDRDSQETRL